MHAVCTDNTQKVWSLKKCCMRSHEQYGRQTLQRRSEKDSTTLNWIMKWCSSSSHTVHLFVLHVHIPLTAVTSSESCCKPHKCFQITLMGRTSLRQTVRQTIRIPGNPNTVILSPRTERNWDNRSWHTNKRRILTSTNMIKAIMCPLSGDTSLDDHRWKDEPLTGQQRQKILGTGTKSCYKKIETDRNRLPPRIINSFYRCRHVVQTSLCVNAAGRLVKCWCFGSTMNHLPRESLSQNEAKC